MPLPNHFLSDILRRKKRGIYFSKRRRRWPWALATLAIVTILTYAVIYLSENSIEHAGQRRRAAILDGLSIDYPNQTFIESAMGILSYAGYDVDVYNSENITLELLKELPTRDYDLVIFRVHGGRIRQPVGIYIGSGLFIERCSPESNKEEIESGYLLIGRPFLSNDTYCVAPPHYIADKLQGSFRSALIIAMSCFTGNDNVMATAFFKRGAGAYIGFSGKVSPDYADAFTVIFLRKLYVEELPLQEAFNRAREELGPDPYYEGIPMLYLP